VRTIPRKLTADELRDLAAKARSVAASTKSDSLRAIQERQALVYDALSGEMANDEGSHDDSDRGTGPPILSIDQDTDHRP
jgi:hypothetical protein